MKQDKVNHPAHYNQGAVECLDAIEAALIGLEGIEAYCIGNAIKYLWRWKHKGGIEDLNKSIFYIDRCKATLEKCEEKVEVNKKAINIPNCSDMYEDATLEYLREKLEKAKAANAAFLRQYKNELPCPPYPCPKLEDFDKAFKDNTPCGR